MHREGAIVLGTGGDNSKASVGSFFEGVMTAGYPTDAADSAVQANIISVGHRSKADHGPRRRPLAKRRKADAVVTGQLSAIHTVRGVTSSPGSGP